MKSQTWRGRGGEGRRKRGSVRKEREQERGVSGPGGVGDSGGLRIREDGKAGGGRESCRRQVGGGAAVAGGASGRRWRGEWVRKKKRKRSAGALVRERRSGAGLEKGGRWLREEGGRGAVHTEAYTPQLYRVPSRLH